MARLRTRCWAACLAAAMSTWMWPFELDLVLLRKNSAKSLRSKTVGLSQLTMSEPRQTVSEGMRGRDRDCSFFSFLVRSNLVSPRLRQMSLQVWEWKKRAMPLVPRFPSPYPIPERGNKRRLWSTILWTTIDEQKEQEMQGIGAFRCGWTSVWSWPWAIFE